MGISKSYRAGPGFQSNNTVGGASKTGKSKMTGTPDGTHESGPDDFGRKGMKNSARAKSKTVSGGGPSKY